MNSKGGPARQPGDLPDLAADEERGVAAGGCGNLDSTYTKAKAEAMLILYIIGDYRLLLIVLQFG
jgi:hypothetical protein